MVSIPSPGQLPFFGHTWILDSILFARIGGILYEHDSSTDPIRDISCVPKFQTVALPTNAAFASKIQGHIGTQQDLRRDQTLEPL